MDLDGVDRLDLSGIDCRIVMSLGLESRAKVIARVKVRVKVMASFCVG